MRVISGPNSMDNSRKNDSIATKTHPTTTANQQQTVYDQTQQAGEMLAGMAATGAASKTETNTATEKIMSDNIIGGGVQRDQTSVDTTGILKGVLEVLGRQSKLNLVLYV